MAWAAATPDTTIYAIQPGREFVEPATLLGADFAGVLVRDGWAPYRQFTRAIHQTCLTICCAAVARSSAIIVNAHDMMWKPAHQLGGGQESCTTVGISWWIVAYRGIRMIARTKAATQGTGQISSSSRIRGSPSCTNFSGQAIAVAA